jgi:hypothetical protein
MSSDQPFKPMPANERRIIEASNFMPPLTHPVSAIVEGRGMVYLALALLRIQDLPIPLGILLILFLAGYGFYYFFLRPRSAR